MNQFKNHTIQNIYFSSLVHNSHQIQEFNCYISNRNMCIFFVSFLIELAINLKYQIDLNFLMNSGWLYHHLRIPSHQLQKDDYLEWLKNGRIWCYLNLLILQNYCLLCYIGRIVLLLFFKCIISPQSDKHNFFQL